MSSRRASDKPSAASVIEALLERHGLTYAEELEIGIGKNTPSPLFCWLCAALLMSARISTGIAVKAAAGLFARGWTTAHKMQESTWRQRVDALNDAGYGRFDESTARMLGDGAARLLDQYGGDLRRLRQEAKRRPQAEREALKAFKGIGDVGADIFLREMQGVWDELYPFLDPKAARAASQLGLPASADGLAACVAAKNFPRLATALIRAAAADDIDIIRQQAAAKEAA
ncbi:MAG: hypothetical protein Tsb0016_02430 [Sphingomonadales bacterium]